MTNVQDFMTADHRRSDESFLAVESAVAAGDWATAARSWEAFQAILRHHFAMEEEVLFPAFEAQTGSAGGPTAVMREDHGQIRAILDGLAARLEGADAAGFAGLAETLMIMTQQHNMKEEQVLYPMADQTLPDAARVVSDMQSHEAAGDT